MIYEAGPYKLSDSWPMPPNELEVLSFPGVTIEVASLSLSEQDLLKAWFLTDHPTINDREYGQGIAGLQRSSQEY